MKAYGDRADTCQSVVGFKKEGVLISSVKFQGRSYAMLEDSSSQENLKEDEDLSEQVENKREDSVIEKPSLMKNIVTKQPIQKGVCKDY